MSLHGDCTVNRCSRKTWSAAHLRTFTQIARGCALTSLTSFLQEDAGGALVVHLK